MADFKPKVVSSAGHDKLLDDSDNLVLVNAPAADSHGTNKKYVDDQINAITGGDTPTSSIYVKRSGDDMSGNLTIATDKIVLNATNGSAEFAGVVSSGGSVFLNPVNGALEVYQPNGVIDTTPAVLVQDSGDQFNAIIEGSGTIKIGGDGSFNSVANAPATRLNNDGSASFAGGIDTNSESTDGMQIDSQGGVAVQRSDGNGLAFTILNKKVNTLNIKADGSADFAQQKVKIYSNGVVRTGSNPGNDGQFGTDINPYGPLRIRTSDADAIRIYPATGIDKSITLNSNGNATFTGDVSFGDINSKGVRIRPATPAIEIREDTDDTAVFHVFNGGFFTDSIKIEFKSDGRAKFANIVNAHGAKFLIAAGGSADKPPGTAPEIVTYSPHQVNIGQGAKWYNWASGYKESSESAEVMTASIAWDGSATFDGSVIVGGAINLDVPAGNVYAGGTFYKDWVGGNSGTPLLAADEAILWLEPDNDANYTTTTDAEGNTISVYNGPTLDIKATLQSLLQRDNVINRLQERIEMLEGGTPTAFAIDGYYPLYYTSSCS